ncbi:sigma-54 interaction domain-containing protein [Virgibacillus necropolis]|uniref:Sigma-54-dependent Fis family transcriptional regulator n=1 Tax=Virgibacillus necropolis TaxID=163877 RepID=A0A221MEY9_9BACI|nr:sigma 54-interacting transcriptional regulator [Virgibacillus necropolis]ASN06139.1 sigma-54-dependent Fis family transcriptional regulator [Virgibacillus necropolis]
MVSLDSYRDEIFETVFEHAYHCFVVVNEEGLITYLNNTYCDFLGVDKSEAIGVHVADVIENSRMHIVARTGIEEIADLQYIRGNHMIANRIPIHSDGRVVGAVGTVLFRDTKEWMKMNSHIKDLLLELEHYRNQFKNKDGATYSLHDIVGSSRQMNDLKNKIKKISPGDVSILFRGESGTGKELFAHSVHQLSERNTKPFVTVNCAAIPDHLLESELFGYEDGAFTGARKGGKLGKFQLADGGTLFLDEIGDMPLSAQVKILRVLQEGEVEAVGSVNTQKVDVRIIAATNQPLERLIEEQRFREDLFYRINVIQVHIPPLRDRPEDLRVLSKFFLDKVTNRTGKRVIGIDLDVLDRFVQLNWPGNIRELENVIESAVHLTNTELIKFEDLPDHIQLNASFLKENGTLKEIMENTEKQVIEKVLNKVNGDKTKAKELLGIGKSNLYDKIKKYGL